MHSGLSFPLCWGAPTSLLWGLKPNKASHLYISSPTRADRKPTSAPTWWSRKLTKVGVCIALSSMKIKKHISYKIHDVYKVCFAMLWQYLHSESCSWFTFHIRYTFPLQINAGFGFFCSVTVCDYTFYSYLVESISHHALVWEPSSSGHWPIHSSTYNQKLTSLPLALYVLYTPPLLPPQTQLPLLSVHCNQTQLILSVLSHLEMQNIWFRYSICPISLLPDVPPTLALYAYVINQAIQWDNTAFISRWLSISSSNNSGSFSSYADIGRWCWAVDEDCRAEHAG